MGSDPEEETDADILVDEADQTPLPVDDAEEPQDEVDEVIDDEEETADDNL